MSGTEPYAKPIPDLNDPDMGPFWAATRERRLTAQKCLECGALRFPAIPICESCLSERFEWVDVSPRGTIWSYVVYHRAFHPGFTPEVPYVVALVENDDGLRFTGQVRGLREQIAVGSRVTAHFDQATEEFTMVQWTVSGNESR